MRWHPGAWAECASCADQRYIVQAVALDDRGGGELMINGTWQPVRRFRQVEPVRDELRGAVGWSFPGRERA